MRNQPLKIQFTKQKDLRERERERNTVPHQEPPPCGQRDREHEGGIFHHWSWQLSGPW